MNPFRTLGLRTREQLFGYALLLPALLIVVAFMAYPLYVALDLSLRDAQTMNLAELSSQAFTLDHYRNLFTEWDWLPDLWRSVVYTLGVVLPAFVLGTGLALLLNAKFPGRRILRPLVLLPWAVPGVAVAAGFRWILDASYGVANYLLRTVGLIDGTVSWFVSNDTAMAAVIVPTIWKYYPFFTLVVLAALQAVPSDLYEAARVDGASALQKFRHVTWPAIRSASVLALIIGGLGVFREFDFIYPLTGGGPNGATRTLAIRIYEEAFRFFNLGDSAAIGVITVVLSAIVVLGMSRSMRREFF